MINLSEIFTPNSYIISDHHFGHAGICNYEPQRCRRAKELGYASVEDMLIDKHNSTISDTDIVIFLGDFSFKDPQNYIHKLNGRKFLILGNHDRHGPQPYRGFEYVFRGVYSDFNGYLFTYKPEDQLLSGVITGIGDKTVCFSHYAIGSTDEYDNQRGRILERKAILNDLFFGHSMDINIHGHLHSKQASGPSWMRYINTCCEHLDYTPTKIRDLL